jgi:hypothetical protein
MSRNNSLLCSTLNRIPPPGLPARGTVRVPVLSELALARYHEFDVRVAGSEGMPNLATRVCARRSSTGSNILISAICKFNPGP